MIKIFSKSRSSFIILIIVLWLLNRYLLLILRLTLRILVELRRIVSRLKRSPIVINGLAISLILNRLILVSLDRRMWSTRWVAWRLGKYWGCRVFNCHWYFLLLVLLSGRRGITIVNDNRLGLINNIGSSLSSNAANDAQAETKSHAWVEWNHGCPCCKIRGRAVIAWIITNIIVISIYILRTAYLITCAVVASTAIFHITNFLLQLLIRGPWRNVRWVSLYGIWLLILLDFKRFFLLFKYVWILGFFHFLKWFIMIYIHKNI